MNRTGGERERIRNYCRELCLLAPAVGGGGVASTYGKTKVLGLQKGGGGTDSGHDGWEGKTELLKYTCKLNAVHICCGSLSFHEILHLSYTNCYSNKLCLFYPGRQHMFS